MALENVTHAPTLCKRLLASQGRIGLLGAQPYREYAGSEYAALPVTRVL